MAPRESSDKIYCEYCGNGFHPNGFPNHLKKCEREHDTEQSGEAYRVRKAMKRPAVTHHEKQTKPKKDTVNLDNEAIGQDDCNSDTQKDAETSSPSVGRIADSAYPSSQYSEHELDSIKTIYHPASGKQTKIQRFKEYQTSHEEMHYTSPDTKPWSPFRSRTDFEVAELALSASMNKEQTTKLIELLHHVAYGHDKFTIQNETDLKKTWELASEKTTKFVKDEITVPYRDDPQRFEVLYRPLWEWLEELLSTKELVSKMEWDAKQLYKFNGQEWCRFIDEPWTADKWWNIQSSLPQNGKPLCILIYADKNKLSSFGTAKGYPVIARCANLPIDIRNGVGPGGHIVGWHPIVPEDSAHTHKKDFVDFKSIVWHESASKIFESIFQYSQTGYAMTCGDLISRLLFPLVMIASSDYEEQ
ncbi:hypothetical protein VKT23_011580 [Stygiomarasmius scandens]|uniref:Uncharacterized protein n=1 Tax=Marasmiellus scandens TaxID=2682957 RepID=A0ABR1J959_9AGAR